MDPHGLSVLSHLRAKPVGKVRRRVRELRSANAYYGEGGGGGPPTLDLSHSESQRLAVDALMGEGGVQGYRDLLTTEGEVDFLSEREKSYILTNQQDGCVGGDSDTVDGEEDEDGTSEPCRDPLSLCRLSASEESADECVTLEPNLPLGSQNGVKPSGSDQQSQSSVEVFLQSDIREGSMKDLVREQIRKAQTALVVAVDTFSDVELLCDILEACALRNVRVYVLLDSLNVQQFLDMCLTLNVSGKHFPRLSVRSVSGQGYCTKTGRWLCGQVTQTFIISDWTRVLTGCYSFSWLSWKVNRNFIVLLEGGSVTSFRQEFRRLYLSSQPVPPLFPTATTLDPSAPRPTQHPNPSDSGLRSLLKSQRWVDTGDHNGTTDRPKAEAAAGIPTAADPTHLALSELEVEHNRVEAYVMSLALDEAPTQTQAESPSRWNREMPQHLGKAEVDPHGPSDVNVSAGRRWRMLQAYASHAPPSDPIGPTFSRSHKLNVTGVDAAWSPHGPSASRTQTSPQAGTTNPTTGGGRLYPDYNRHRRAAMESGTAAVNLDTLRRSQRTDLKAQPRPEADAQPLHRSLSQRAHNQGNTQGFFVRTQRQWPAAQPSPQNNRCRTQSPKGLRSPAHPHHLGPGAASKDTQSYRLDAKTDFRTPVNQQPESGFSLAATKGPPPDHQSYPAQQLVPSQRLHWISQLHSRQVLQNGPGANGTWGPRRGTGEPGQRDAGTGARGRTSGAIGRPAALRRGASFS